ncbi:site-2 protease family protein [Candidatus Saccharibacteria bacterium]|nr:site-2 protease family protein [Candidatus Saccharibacteria bacterium]
MEIFLGVLIGIFCLLFLVTAHEFGHFIMARKNGVRVLEFGICFPPRAKAWVHKLQKDKDGKIIKKKNGKPLYKWIKIPRKDWKKSQDGLVFSLNLLPIGGFCQMDGESDADTRPQTFGAGSFWTKTKILFGGVMMNWLVSFVIFTILAWVGMPIVLENQFSIDSDKTAEYSKVTVVKIEENSPAERAGFKEGDEILKIEDVDIHTSSDVSTENLKYAGKETNYIIKRTVSCSDVSQYNSEDKKKFEPCTLMGIGIDGTSPELDIILTLKASLNEKDNEYGYLLGVNMESDLYNINRYTWSAPIVGIGTSLQLTAETFKGLGGMLWNLISGAFSQFSPDDSAREAGRQAIESAGDSVSGPIGIISMFIYLYSDIRITLLLFGLISVSLACMNVLPIPALDGGRWLMIFIARLQHKRLTKETEEKIVSKALLILFGLMIFITILDVIRFF